MSKKGRPEIWPVLKDIFTIQLKPQIFFITVVYVMVMIAWVIGVNNTVSQLLLPPPYLFSGAAFACSWLGPIVGAVVGQLWGYWFNKWLFNRCLRRHNGKHNPVNRLWGTYAPTAIGLVGLILYGQAFQHSLHWIWIEIGWACLAFMMVSATTAVSAYCLDCFPKQASLVASIINMWRTTGGFCVVYFQVSWISATGADVAFGLQALILGVAFVVGVVTTQVLGPRINSLLLTAPPYILAMITAFVNALHTDRSAEQVLHITLLLLVAMTAFILAACTTSVAPRYVAIMLMVSDIYTGYVIVLARISNTIPRPVPKRAAALTLINGVPNAASIYVPYMYGGAPRYTTEFWSIAVQRSSPSSWQSSFA
ncbi:hypothetical protein KC365_g16065 [Hortaea werneckii]|nr:hypothetical protein KC365_g16065 [Hortaea werneckii]